MLKREQVWRYLADQTIAGQTGFHQHDIAEHLSMSIGNVNLALDPLRELGAAEVVAKKVVIRDIKKLLIMWAARHDPEPLLGAFGSPVDARASMRVLPSRVALTSFAGFLASYPERPNPAPIPHLRAYVDPADTAILGELRERFTEQRDGATAVLRIHAADAVMAASMPSVVSPAQLYVDLWSESDFFAGDYLRALETELHL